MRDTLENQPFNAVLPLMACSAGYRISINA